PRQSRDLFNGLATGTQPQSREEGSHLRRRGDAGHNLFHDCCGLVFAERSSGGDVGDCFTNHHWLFPSHSGWDAINRVPTLHPCILSSSIVGAIPCGRPVLPVASGLVVTSMLRSSVRGLFPWGS